MVHSKKNTTLKDVLSPAGIDTEKFKSHSTQSASTSKAALGGLAVSDILAKCHWSRKNWQKFHKRSIEGVLQSSVFEITEHEKLLYTRKNRMGNSVHAFLYISNTFISNYRMKLAKNQGKAKQHPAAEFLLFETYSLSLSSLSLKNIRRYSKKSTKNKYVCLNRLDNKNEAENENIA